MAEEASVFAAAGGPEETDPAAAAAPAISSTTLAIAGLKVDIYGLAELPATATSVSCLWLHHPRLKKKEDMAETANLAISAHNHNHNQTQQQQTNSKPRGLIAVAFDQRNHGTREVDPRANQSWNRGNATHAQDMLGTVSGTVSDTVHLIDVLESHLFGAGDGPGALPPPPLPLTPAAGGDGGDAAEATSSRQQRPPSSRQIDQHLVLGISLGGHSSWQLLFADPRVTAGVIVIGCPDYMRLLKDRARKSKLPTYTGDEGASFLGSKDFPEALVRACGRYDPKGILFGAGEIPAIPATAAEQDRLRPLLDAKVRGKRFQILSGGADKLVPYAAATPFLEFFKDAVDTWYRDGDVYVEDNVYAGVGHAFDTAMKKDAVRFVVDAVARADKNKAASAKI